MGTLILLILIGVAVGFWLIKRGTAKAQAGGNTRDHVTVPDTADTRATIARWAEAHGYELAGDSGSLLRYQKHAGKSSGQPTFLDARPENGSLVLESYVGVINPFTRKPKGEMSLGAPGMILAIPRKSAKRDHNVLRSELGLPSIA